MTYEYRHVTYLNLKIVITQLKIIGFVAKKPGSHPSGSNRRRAMLHRSTH